MPPIAMHALAIYKNHSDQWMYSVERKSSESSNPKLLPLGKLYQHDSTMTYALDINVYGWFFEAVSS